MTSRDVVDLVGRAARQRRCGHAGTLDPLATGVLVVAVGKATRLVEYVQRTPKCYVAEFLLGQTSDTDDVEGDVSLHAAATPPTRAQVEQALAQFVGTIPQRPPAYSAVKIGGKRAYDLARRGQEVELEPRPVEIYGIHLIGYEFPRLQLQIDCGSGVYIRSLARDLGEVLETGALMSRLTRTAVGGFRVEESCSVDNLKSDDWIAYRRDLREGVSSLPPAELDAEQTQAFLHGRRFPCDRSLAEEEEFAAFDVDGRFLGVALCESRGVARAVKGGFA